MFPPCCQLASPAVCTALTYSFSYLEPVCCSMSSSNCCFLTCTQISQEAGQVVWQNSKVKGLLSLYHCGPYCILDVATPSMKLFYPPTLAQGSTRPGRVGGCSLAQGSTRPGRVGGASFHEYLCRIIRASTCPEHLTCARPRPSCLILQEDTEPRT